MNTRAQELFVQARGMETAARGAFLAQACGEDAELHLQIQRMLVDAARADSYFGDENGGTVGAGEFQERYSEKEGDQIGPFKLRQSIGEGGFGMVWMAEQSKPISRMVALKVIKAGMDTKQVLARFEAERQALAMMDHPNIAKVLDAGATATGRPWFAMELVKGIPITDYCDQTALGTHERLKLFRDVCAAINHAHQKGIIHRDIKPSNVMVTLHGDKPVVKVIDFGIAKATQGKLTDQTLFTRFEQFIGTPVYMSPEQAEMSGLDIDTRSDIYSLGVLLYELLTGSTPFDSKELMSLGVDAMRKTIREKDPIRPSTKLSSLKGDQLTTTAKRRSADSSKLLRQLRGDLDWIVMKCLEKDRSRRYETANGLSADIKRHLGNEPVVARPPGKIYEFQKTVRRHKFGFGAAAAIMIVLFTGVLTTSSQMLAARKAQRETEVARSIEHQQRLAAQRKQAEAEAERARADVEAVKARESEERSRRLLYVSDMNLAQQSLRQNNLGLVRRLLDRHRPRPGEEDLRGWEWRYLWRLSQNNAMVTLTQRQTRGWSVSFSRDGRRLAVGWWDGRVDLWDVPTRRLIRTVVKGGEVSPASVAFSPVADLLAASTGDSKVTLYDLDSGKETDLPSLNCAPGRFVRDLSFSKDGSKLLIFYPSREGMAEASIIDISTHAIEARYPAKFNGSVFLGAARLSPDKRRLYVSQSNQANGRCGILCIDAATGAEIWQTEPHHDGGLTALEISPDGRKLVSGSAFEDPSIRVWDAATGRLIRQLDAHTAWTSHLAFSEDGRQLVSSAADQTIRFWDTDTWSETHLLRGHRDEIHGVAISEPMQMVASTSKDGDLMLWDLKVNGASDGYIRLQEERSSTRLVPLDHSRVLLLPSGKPPEIANLRQYTGASHLDGVPTSDHVLVGSCKELLCLWNGTNEIHVTGLHGEESVQRAVVTLGSGVKPDRVACNVAGRLLAWNEPSHVNSVFMADIDTTGHRVEFKSDASGLIPALFSEDGRFLVAWSKDNNSLRAWDTETGEVAVSIDESFTAAALAAGGWILVAIHRENESHVVAFHDLTQPERAPTRFTGRFHSFNLAVSPDGTLVALSTEGGEILMFDAAKEALIESIRGHLNGVFGLAFSPDGRRLISMSWGLDSIKIWDVSTRQVLISLTGKNAPFSVDWSTDGDAILAGYPWQAWCVPSWDEISAAEDMEEKAAGK